MLVYVAGPYSAPTPQGILDNIAAARVVAIELWEKGLAVHCPHLNTSGFEIDCACTWEDYLKADEQIISRCDALCMMPNWNESKGAVREHFYAQDRGIPVYYYPDIPVISLTETQSPVQSSGFLDTVMRMYRIHLAKNSDYGPLNILATGEIGLVTRLWDKMARLLNLTGFRIDISSSVFEKPRAPRHESIDDTYSDLAVYGVIGMLLRQGKWGH